MDSLLVAAIVAAILMVLVYLATRPSSDAKSPFWGSKPSNGSGTTPDDSHISSALAELARQNAPGRSLTNAGAAVMGLTRATAPSYNKQGMQALSAAQRNVPVYIPRPAKDGFWAGPNYAQDSVESFIDLPSFPLPLPFY